MSFNECLEVERLSSTEVLEWLIRQGHIHNGQYVWTHTGKQAKAIQKERGDLLFNLCPTKELVIVELKAEKKYTGNLFLEEWSNRSWGTRGWMYHINCDYLFYHFLLTGELVILSWPELYHWAIELGYMEEHELKKQTKNPQLNDSWGRLVPVEVLREYISMKEYNTREVCHETYS